jgi:N-acetylglucosaminyl-diphospho-decaprenol L-rhamnosyltransferase
MSQYTKTPASSDRLRTRARASEKRRTGRTASVIVPTVTPDRLSNLLRSLSHAGSGFETIIVDNGTGAEELTRAAASIEDAQVLRLDSNLGYSKAVNQAARIAQGDVLVLLNDDSVVEPGYVEAITAALDPTAGVVMAAGVMRDPVSPDLIETAGIELDWTLLAFDYLNGEDMEILDRGVADPVGPSGSNAAYWREAFLEAGGFDERIFAYLEDVDLALRIRRAGGSCRLARTALGVHEHSATLGSGSRRKNYLMGWGRGYLLRKWSVITPRRLPGIAAREVYLGVGQALVDRNLGGLRGRLDGLRAGERTETYPGPLPDPPKLLETLQRRWRRRSRLRSR